MPEYSFHCEKCETKFSEYFPVSEYAEGCKNAKCPACKSKKVYRDIAADNVGGHVIGGLHEAKTLGEYADKQTAKMSKDEVEARLESYKTKKNPNSGMKELPTGMTRAKTSSDMPRITKQQAKKKRKGK